MKTIRPDFNNLRILIVDNDNFIAKILISVLDTFDITSVQLTAHIDDAIKITKAHEFDCIFVDNMMSDENGLALAQHIRRSNDQRLRETAIILCTSYTGVRSVIDARDSGITEILAKPFSPEQIMVKLNNALNNKRNFVTAKAYLGPDRRRKIHDIDPTDDKRSVALPPVKK